MIFSLTSISSTRNVNSVHNSSRSEERTSGAALYPSPTHTCLPAFVDGLRTQKNRHGSVPCCGFDVISLHHGNSLPTAGVDARRRALRFRRNDLSASTPAVGSEL